MPSLTIRCSAEGWRFKPMWRYAAFRLGYKYVLWTKSGIPRSCEPARTYQSSRGGLASPLAQWRTPLHGFPNLYCRPFVSHVTASCSNSGAYPPPGLLIYVLMTAGAALGSTGALRRSSAFLHQALLLDLYIQTNQELRPARQSLLVYFQTAGLLHRTDTIRIQEIA